MNSEKKNTSFILISILVLVLFSCLIQAGSITISEVASLESSRDSITPSLDVDSNNVIHAVWSDKTNITRLNTGPDWDILYNIRNSSEWSSPEIVNNELTGGVIVVSNQSRLQDLNPQIVIDANDDVHVVWDGLSAPTELTADSKTRLLHHFNSYTIDYGPGISTEYQNAPLNSYSVLGKSIFISNEGDLSNQHYFKFYDPDGDSILNETIGTIEFWFNPQWNPRIDGSYTDAFRDNLAHILLNFNDADFLFYNTAEDSEPLGISMTLEGFNGEDGPTMFPVNPLWDNNEWHHIAFAYNTTAGEYKLYVDCRLEDIYISPNTTRLIDVSNLTLGHYILVGTELSSDGYFDELRVSDGLRTQEEILQSCGFHNIMYSRKNSGEENFSDPIAVAENNSYNPRIAADSSNNVHLTWTKIHNNTYSDVYYKMKNSTDWSEEELVSQSSRFPDIAVNSSDDPHIVSSNITLKSNDFPYNDFYYNFSWNRIVHSTKGTGWNSNVISNYSLFNLAGHLFPPKPKILFDSSNNLRAVWADTLQYPAPELLFYASFDDEFDADFAQGSRTATYSGISLSPGTGSESYYHTGASVSIAGSDYLNYSATDNINLSKGTIGMWVSPNIALNTLPDDDTINYFLFSAIDNVSGTMTDVLSLAFNRNDLSGSYVTWLGFKLLDNESQAYYYFFNAEDAFPSNELTYVSVTWDTNNASGNRDIEFLIDETSYPLTSDLVMVLPSNQAGIKMNETPSIITVGSFFNGTGYEDQLNGNIDELVIYNETMDSDKILADRIKDFDIFYRYNDGSGWSDTILLSSISNYLAINPSIYQNDGVLHVVGAGATSEFDYFNKNRYGADLSIFETRVDTSDTSLPYLIVSDESTDSGNNPDVIARSNKIDFIWEDDSDKSGEDLDIFYRRTTNSSLPSVSIYYPAGGEVIDTDIIISGNATDTDDTVSNITYYYTSDDGLTGALACTAYPPTFNCTWNILNVAENNYKLKAVATSDDGGKNQILGNLFYVNSDPNVLLYTYEEEGYLGNTNFAADDGYTNRTDLEIWYSGLELADASEINLIKSSDNSRWSTSKPPESCGFFDYFNGQLYIMYINESASEITTLKLYWKGEGQLGENTNLSIYNFNTESFESVDYKIFSEEEDDSLSMIIESNIKDYVNDSNHAVAFLIETGEEMSKSCPLSCPFVYSYNGTDYVYEHESYALSVLDFQEGSSYESLDNIARVDGTYILELNELLDEISYTDQLELTVVDSTKGFNVVPDIHGNLHTIKEKIAPMKAVDSNGRDAYDEVIAKDDKFWKEEIISDDKDVIKGYLELEFPNKNKDMKLSMSIIKSDIVTYIWMDAISKAGQFFPTMQKIIGLPLIKQIYNSMYKREIYLKVQLWDGKSWKTIDHVKAGGENWNDNLVVLPTSSIDTETINVRLSSSKGFYEVDHVSADYTNDEYMIVYDTELISAIKNNKEDVKDLLEYDDGRYVIETQGDSVRMVFEAIKKDIPLNHSRDYILKVDGYYNYDHNYEQKLSGIIFDLIPYTINSIFIKGWVAQNAYNTHDINILNKKTASKGSNTILPERTEDGRYSIPEKTHNTLYTDFVNIVVGKCVTPYDGLHINQNSTLCDGVYPSALDADEDGFIIINNSNIALDCAGAELVGDDLGKGIVIRGLENVTLKNCNATNYYDGISIIDSEKITLFNNTAKNSQYGFHLENINDSYIYDNTASYSYTQYYLVQSNFNIFRNNYALDTSLAIHVIIEGSNNNTIKNNNISGGIGGITLTKRSDNNLIMNNSLDSIQFSFAMFDYGIALNEEPHGESGINNNFTLNNASNTDFGFGILNPEFNDYMNYIDTTNKFNEESIYYYTNINGIPSAYIELTGFDLHAEETTFGIGKLTIINSSYVNITGNNISGSHMQVAAISSNNIEISNNNLSNMQIFGDGLGDITTSMGFGAVSSDHIKVINNIFSEGRRGIFFANSTDTNVTYNNFTDLDTSIELSDSRNFRIINNNLMDNDENGIYLSNTNSTIISSNWINDTQYGIWIRYSYYNTLYNNDINHSYWGVRMQESHNNMIEDNNIERSTNYAMFISDSDENTLRNNICSYSSGDACMFLSNSDNNIIDNNTGSFSKRAIYLSNSDSNIISNNTALDNAGFYGIQLSYSSDNNITNNYAARNSIGFSLTNSNTVLDNNTAINNTQTGFELNTLTDNSFYNNTAINNTRSGFRIWNSDHINLIGSTSSLNGMGYLIEDSENCSVSSGSSINNTLSGINFTSSSDNWIADSYIINNISGPDVFSDESSDNDFINVSFDHSNSAFGDATSMLDVKWRVSYYIQDEELIPINSIYTNLTDSLNNEYIKLSDNMGYSRFNLSEYMENSTSKEYYSNYSWDISRVGYSSNASEFNLTENKHYDITLLLETGINDTTPPTEAVVLDGLNYIDYDWTNNRTTLHASWFNSTDRHLIFYTYRIFKDGICLPGYCSEIDVGQDTQVSVTGLDLIEGSNYTFAVRARDSSYYYTPYSFSDGITTDFTPPNITVNSTTHPDQDQWYSNPNVTMFFYGNDSASGIAGYSFILNQEEGTAPDRIMESRPNIILSEGFNDGHSTVLKTNSTGEAFSIFSEIEGNLTAGDNLTISIELLEEVSDLIDEMSFRVYVVPGSTTIDSFSETSSAVSDIVTRTLDITNNNPLNADTYTINLEIDSDVDDSFYIVVSGIASDDDNTHNLSIAGSTSSFDNETDTIICDESSDCSTVDADYAIEVIQHDSRTINFKKYYNLENGIYYFHARAKDVAGNWGNPAHYRIKIDAINGTPIITLLKPRGYIATTSPLLVVETNEETTCYYNTTNSSQLQMQSFDDLHHEKSLSLPVGTYTYGINCTDYAGNSVYNETTFIIDPNAVPDSVVILDIDDATAGKDMTAIVNVTKIYGGEYYGLGELSEHFIVTLIGAETSNVYAEVTDLGDGIYEVTITAPSEPGSYTLQVEVKGISDTESFSVNEYTLKIRYTESGLTATVLPKLVYSGSSGYTIGLASTGESATTTGSGGSNLIIGSIKAEEESFIIMTRSSADIDSREKYIDDGTFSDLENPSFGYDLLKENFIIATILNYDDIILSGDYEVSNGMYNLIIRNEGINQTSGKTIISIRVV